MKQIFILVIFISSLLACREHEPIFEKSADERVAEAISNLRSQLTAPQNGWLLRYKPVQESGTYIVLLDFDESDNLRIRTDFSFGGEDFFDQTITYRVDNSLGLELIFENYSFFSFLAEQGNATFLAEFEFDYVNETPDGDLVFRSKTDPSSPTTLVFQPAPDNAESLLGRTVNTNLENLSGSLGLVSPVYRLDYANRDLSLFLSLNTALRTINFSSVSSATGERRQAVNFSTGYAAQGNSIVLDEPLVGNFLGNEVNIPAINFQSLTNAPTVEACGQTFNIQQYQGAIAESSQSVALLPTLFEPGGADFRNASGTYLANPGDIYQNGESAGLQVTQDIEGMIGLVVYYFDRDQDPFIAMGFGLIQNDELVVPVRDFTPSYTDNQIGFAFEMDYEVVIGDTTAVLDIAAMDTYINNLTSGGQVRILQSREGAYEFYNPCTGWSALLQRL